MEKITSPIEKKIYKKLNAYFAPKEFSNPNYWYYFEQVPEERFLSNYFYFDFDCKKNIHEIELPMGEYIFSLNRSVTYIKVNKIESFIQPYVAALKANKVNTANIDNKTIAKDFKDIFSLTAPDFPEISNRYRLSSELDNLIERLINQISEVIFPYSNQFNDIQFLDKIINSSLENYEPFSFGDYGTVFLKKMIIAQLAGNPDFELISTSMKEKFILRTHDENEKKARNWAIALSLFDEMYEKIKSM